MRIDLIYRNMEEMSENLEEFKKELKDELEGIENYVKDQGRDMAELNEDEASRCEELEEKLSMVSDSLTHLQEAMESIREIA